MFLNRLFEDPAYFFQYLVIIILSICLHELSHGYAAISQGDDTPKRLGHITLNPIVHMGVPSLLFLCFSGMAWGLMPVTRSNFRDRKYGDMIVAAAGPLMNLALALMAIALINIALSLSWDGALTINFVYLFAYINLILFLFNLLPIPPLDGYSVWSTLFPGLKVLEGQAGMALLVMLFVLPVFGRTLATGAQSILNAFLPFG